MPTEPLSVILDAHAPIGINESMLAINRALVRTGLPTRTLQRFSPVRLLGRALGRYELNRNLFQIPRRACLTVLAWPNDGRAFPYGLAYEIIPWICDCWPGCYDKWERLFRRNRVRTAFF